MNEEALQQLYSLAQGEGYSKSYEEFQSLMSSNEDALDNMYAIAQSEGYRKNKDDFKTLVGFGGQPTATETVEEEPKKKGFLETMQEKAIAAGSPSTSEEQPSSLDLQEETPEAGTQRTLNGKPLIVAYNAQGEAVYLDFSGAIVGKVGDPVIENQLAEEERLIYERTGEAPKKVEGGLEYTDEEGETTFVAEPEPLENRLAREEYEANLRRLAGTPQQEEFIETQGPMAGLPVTQPLEARGADVARDVTQNIIQEDDSPMAARDPFGVAPLERFPTVSKAAQKTMGENLWEGIKYYTGMDVNERGRDPFSAGILYLGDELFELWGDAARSVYAGFDQGAAVSPSLGLMRNGRDATDEEIDRFVKAYNRMASTPPSDEMESFMQIYEDGGKTLASWFNGVKANPTVLPQLFISSTAAMANSQSTILAAILGAPIAAVNPRAGLSVTMGLASGSLDGALTFGELLQEEIGEDIPLTNENVRAVLEDDEAYNRIVNESLRRGLTIGMIDAATGFGTVGVTKRVLKGTTRTLGRTGGKVVASTAGGAVEVGGGVSSEVLGRIAANQEQDIAEAAFEGVVGKTVDAPAAIGYGIYEGSQPEYKMNGGVASRADVINFLETSTDEQFAAVPLQIVNDEGLLALATDRKNKIKNIKTAQEEVVAAGVTDPQKVSELSRLESDKQQLEGNNTEAGKRRLQEINDQINSILDEPTEVTTETEAVRIYEGKDRNGNTKQVKLTTQENGRIRLDIVNDDGSTALIGDFPAESTDTDIISNIIDIQQDFNIVKPQDAIQESSTETVDVQEPTRDSEAVGERDATGPVTTEGEAEVQVEETPLTVREEAADLAAMVGEELQAPAPTTEAAPTVTEETTVTEEAAPAAELTDDQREVMYESDRKSALNGLGYKNDYIGDILEKIYGQLSDRSFSSTWRKHVDPFFSSEYVGLSGGMTFRQYTSEEMIGQRFFVTDVIADKNGMQKFIDFVNDANKKIAKKGGQTVDLVPLERTAPTVTEEAAPVTEEMPTPGTVEIYEGIDPYSKKTERVGVVYTDDGGVLSYRIKPDGKIPSWTKRGISPAESKKRRAEMGYRDMVDDHISEFFSGGRDFRVISTEAPSTEAPVTVPTVSEQMPAPGTVEIYEGISPSGSKKRIEVIYTDDGGVAVFGIGADGKRTGNRSAIPPGLSFARRTDMGYRDMVDDHISSTYFNKGRDFRVVSTEAPSTEAPTTYDFESVFQAEKATTEAAPVAEEAAPVAELTAQQREFITEDDAGINGLAYNPTYIETVWNNIIDVLGDKSFTSLFKKHINEDFTSSMIEEELEEFSSTMIDLDDGMQKFIDLVNDANKRIKRKGGNQINLMPLERTAPSSESLIELGMTDENTEADFKRFEQEYKDRNPFQVDPFNEDLTDKRKQARDAKAKQYAQEQVKKMLQESKAPTKPAPAPKAAPVTEQAAPKDKTQSEIDELNADIERNESSVISLKEEIEIEKGNIKDQKERIDKEVQDIKKSGERQFAKTILLEELKEEKRQAIEDHKDLLEDYRQQIKQLNSDIKKDKNKVKKLEASIAKAPAKPKPTTTESRPLKEEIKNRVEKIANEGAGYAFPWFNSIVERAAGIDTDAEIKEYYIQSIENGATIGKLEEDFYKRDFKRLGIDPKLYVEDLSDLFRPTQVHVKAKDVDLNDYKLFRYIESGRNYGKLYRKIKPAPKEGVSLYVEEGSKVYFDNNDILRPEGGEYGKMAGIYMSDIMLESVSPAKDKPGPAPKAKPTPAPKVEPVAKGVDPFYDSVEAQQKQEERIGKLADRARTAIKKVLPDAKIILHRTEAEYNKATKANSKGSQGGAGSRGVLIGDTIHVNMPHANDRTIAHEVFHALLTNLSKENSVDVINLTKKMAASLKGKIKDKLVLAELDEFVDQYSGQVESAQAEEMVAEFMGILAERYNRLDKPAKSLVQRFLERLADLLGLSKTFVPKAGTRKGQFNTIDLLETLAGKVALGQEIVEQDFAMYFMPYKDGQPDFQEYRAELLAYEGAQIDEAREYKTPEQIEEEQMDAYYEFQKKVQEKMLSPIEQILYRAGVQVTREEYIANRGKPDAPGRDYRGLFHTGKPEVDAVAKELTDRLQTDMYGQDIGGIVITEEDIFNYIDERANTKGKFTQKNLKFLRDNGLLDYDQKFGKAPKSPKQQMAELAKDYRIEESGFLSFQINDGILRPKLRKLGYELRRHSTGFTIRDANGRMYRPPTGRGAGRKFQLFGGKDANIAEIVNIARESNINRQATKEFLMSNRGLTAKQADKLLDVSTDNMYTVPVSFGNIGLRDGIVLFEKVANYADKIAKDKKVKVMDRLPMTLEFLEKQPEYIAQADKKTKGPSTIQMQMQSDVQKALGLKKTADMSKRLKTLKEKVRQRKKGARDLKATQRELRNFIRQALPADLYSKSDVVGMMGKITSLRSTEESNIQKLTNEVVGFVTEKQVNFLEKTIDSILNGKYETVESGRKKGRKIDSATRQRFEDIKKNIVGENVPAEGVIKKNETLNNEYSALEGKVDRTIQDDERMLDLAAAMAINHSKLMDNTDVNKVESLQRAEDILSGILGEGKQAFKARLQADHERYKQLISDVYKDITGLDIDPNNPKMMSKLKKDQDKIDRRQKSKIENASKRSIRILNDALKTYIRANYDLNQLMKVIMEAPGAAIQGKTEAIVLDAINEATRTFKEAKLNDKDQISSKLQEIFGKKWQKAVADGVSRRFTGVYIDKQKVANAKAAYDKNPTKENKERYEAIEAVNNIELSPNEIADQYFQYQDKANTPSFENPENENFGPDHKRIMNELVATIDKRHIEFGEWMVNEFLPSKYEFYNDSYEQVYRTNMPWNQNYAGRIYRVGGGEPKTLNLLGKDAVENKVVGAASSKIRRQNNKPIEPQDMYSNLMTYLEEMNWMAAHAPTLRDMDKIFSSPAIRDAISNLDGKNLNELIKIQLERIAARGINPAKGEKFVKFANDLFVTTRLGGYKPSIMFKQLTSFLTYANEIGPVTYTKYSAMSTGEFKSTWKEVMENSVYVRDRVSSDFKRLVANYSNERALDVMPTLSKDRWQNVMFFFSRVGDIGAIFIGGVPNYRYYKADFKSKNPNATEQEVIDYAIRKFEKDTKTTQQSSDIQDKDYFQTGGAIARGINMFLTTSKQYLRREFEGVRQMRRAVRDNEKFEKTKLPAIVKGPAKTLDSMFTDKEFQKGLRTFITFQAVLPAFFQWVNLGFPGIAKDFDDEDKKDMLRSVILGPFNGLFLIGDILTGIADNIQEKPYAGGISFLPLSQQFNEISETYKWWSQSKDGSEKKEKWRNKLFWQIGELVGGGLSQSLGLPVIPIRNLKQLYDNLYKAADAKDTGELVLRMLNYSDYQIEGSKEEERGSERRSTPVSGSSRGGSSGDRPSSRRSSGR